MEEVKEVTREWSERGYGVALWRDEENKEPYPGYAQAVNTLALTILERFPECDWIVTGGDDTLPDTSHTADEIADECTKVFTAKVYPDHIGDYKSTFGVMQPTGDRFAGGCIDRIAGSPWMGREWCLRANGGRGPLWPEFTHMFADEALKRSAEKMGVYWARPDLIHFHAHFQRADKSIGSRAIAKPIPPHLVKWNTRQHWDEMKAIFQRLEAEDFKSCLPI
jgi:hypothetical protein